MYTSGCLQNIGHMMPSNHCQNGSIHETHKDIPAAVVDGMTPNSKYLQLKACTSCLTGMACRSTKRGQKGAVRFYTSLHYSELRNKLRDKFSHFWAM